EPLKPVVRKAEGADIERAGEFEQKEQEAMEICAELIAKLNLPMKLISAEYNFDGSRLTYSFSAEERVDFRQLVRELTSRFKIRVELRQIGPRDETKLIGGFGRCGRLLCCANFLGELAPVSIRMAKEQGLPLNPMKISGCCGRLLCCLNYENEFYREMRGKLPKEGQRISTRMGEAKVIAVNPLKEVVIAELESQATVELPVSEIVSVESAPHRRTRKQNKK
ncbi:MAG TPA: stage 0 sporulation family protein, partial [Dehalococcoidia bacterium]|nr:stage 0 sporulation family protein [Dehalococcoidia bacterium]